MPSLTKNNAVKRKVIGRRAAQGRPGSHLFQNSDASLAKYFRNIGSNNTLDAEEEVAQAKRLFELEQELWAVILGEKARVEPVREIIQEARIDHPGGKIDEVIGMLDQLSHSLTRGKASTRSTAVSTDLISAIADNLRDLDEDRSLIGRVLDRMHRENLSMFPDKLGQEGRRQRRIDAISAQVRQAKHCFIRENLGLVVNIAKRYHVDQMSLSDLIQEGNLGLMRAVDKFDYRKGFRFSTYASWWIRSYISRAIVRKSNTVRIPEYMLRDRNRIKRTEEAHRAKVGQSLNEEELANELGLSQKRLQRTLRHDVAFVESLDREMPGNDNQKYIDFLSDEDAKSPLEMVSLNDWLKSIPKTLEHLSVVERFVISWRFGLVDGDEMTLQEIGQCLSLSRERIRQIQEEALGKLRDQLEVDAA